MEAIKQSVDRCMHAVARRGKFPVKFLEHDTNPSFFFDASETVDIDPSQ
jgi:hypothetical protein